MSIKKLNIPTKNSESYPERFTVCVTKEVFKILENLKTHYNADIPALCRDAINEYLASREITSDFIAAKAKD